MNTALLPKLLAFNYCPAEYMDKSWVSSFEYGDIMEALLESEAGKSWVSRAILRETNLNGSTDLNIENSIKMMALQPHNALVQIIFYAGIILNHDFFRSIIRRQEREAVEACLGKKPYLYAVKKASLLSGRLPELFPCQFTVNWQAPEELKKHVFRSGMRLLGAVFANESDGYKKRLLFKFPRASQDYFYGAGAEKTSGDVHRSGSALFKKLIKEFGAQ